MKSIRFAVIFLDVQMKKMDGEETAKRIRCLDNNLVLAFYTGFVESSPKTLEAQPYRYIMKNTRIHLALSVYGIYDITVEEDKSAPIIHLPVPLESYIINFCYLRTCTGKILKLADVQGDFPIARSMVKAFNEQKERFLQAKYVRGEW